MKYMMTSCGYDEFVANKRQYILPTLRGKLMYTLSSRVGYTLDSLSSQAKSDPRLRVRDGQIIGELQKLVQEGYVEVVE